MKPLTKEELIRSAWITELRRQGERKCEAYLRDAEGMVCAIGLLREVVGRPRMHSEDRIGALAGLNPTQVWQVVIMNDGEAPYGEVEIRPHTFAEIADVIESWFQKK